MRREKDFIGSVELPDDCYYGISTARAVSNFDISKEIVKIDIIYELVNIKKQATIANFSLGFLTEEKKEAIVYACEHILNGEYDKNFVIDKNQGGAGTATNMNVNEVISNVALEYLGKPLGSYEIIHPINHVNLHQSTNDTYPTSIKIAAIRKIRVLADVLASLQQSFQEKEHEYGKILKLSRTEMMDAVPMLAGQMFGAYANAISRDRWRIYKVEERIRTINIGGTAIGTGLNAPLKYTFMMTSLLQESTGIGLSRADDLIDNTQNLDSFVEVSGLLKVAAVNLIKIANDLRYLSSGPQGGIGEIELESMQVGSSIMPGKINPVIPEMVIQSSNRVISNDLLITNLCAAGNLELNSFMPAIGESLLESLDLLIGTVSKFNNSCIKTLVVNKERCMVNLEKSFSLITPLITIIGYDEASTVVKIAQKEKKTIKQVLFEKEYFSEEELEKLLDPHKITQPGLAKR